MQNSTDHAIQNHVCWQGGIFTSGALESLLSLTGQQMKKRVQAASVPQGSEMSGLSYFAIQIQSWIFKTQSKSNHSPKSLRKPKSKSK